MFVEPWQFSMIVLIAFIIYRSLWPANSSGINAFNYFGAMGEKKEATPIERERDRGEMGWV